MKEGKGLRAVRYGIQSFDDIRDRCVVDDITGHWHWKGAFTVNKKGSYPTTWIPALQRTGSISRAIQAIRGKPLESGQIWFRTCSAPDCANPKHYTVGTFSDMARNSRPRNSSLHNAKISRAKRAESGNEKPVHVPASSIFNLAASMGVGT